MLNLGKTRLNGRRFKDSDDGNIMLTFALSLVFIIGLIGAAIDLTTTSTSKGRSQAMADSLALNAALAVKEKGGVPTDIEDEFVEGHEYKAADLGFDAKSWDAGGTKGAKVNFTYVTDPADATKIEEVIVTVEGETVSSFAQILGRDTLTYTAKSTAAIPSKRLSTPVSIAMILDNSSSMEDDDKPMIVDEDNPNNKSKWERPDDAVTRLSALQTSLIDFTADLQQTVNKQVTDENDILRMGMMAYNTAIIPARTVPMDWAIIPAGKINAMVPAGGTNSAPSMGTVKTWMAGEDSIHEDKHGKEPLKYVIFMTDGLNQQYSSIKWQNQEGTGQWKGKICKNNKYNADGTCKKWKNDTMESEDMPDIGKDWNEGHYVVKKFGGTTATTIADCTAMKNAGVTIYTIGFALEEGFYYTETITSTGQRYYEENDIQVRIVGYTFLSQCASDPSTFLTAENAGELKKAFADIGKDIAKDVVRLAN